MAISKSVIQLAGSLANVSMYKRHDSDQVVVRLKGGPTKKHIKTLPQFEKVLQNNSEWGGCTRLEDYPVTGALNGICKQIQKLDTGNDPGRRSVNLSQHKDVLLGFPFRINRYWRVCCGYPSKPRWTGQRVRPMSRFRR